MNIIIDYYEKVAYVEGACHPDGHPYSMKGIRKQLQDKAKADSHYGLEFWFEENPAHPAIDSSGHFEFSIVGLVIE